MGYKYTTGNAKKDARIRMIRHEQEKIQYDMRIVADHCMCCGKDITMNDSELHHIKGVVKGGTNNLWNLTVICHECHRMKYREAVRNDLDIRDSLFNFKYIKRLNKLGNRKIDRLIDKAIAEADKADILIPDFDNSEREKRHLNAINNGLDNWIMNQETDLDDIIAKVSK